MVDEVNEELEGMEGDIGDLMGEETGGEAGGGLEEMGGDAGGELGGMGGDIGDLMEGGEEAEADMADMGGMAIGAEVVDAPSDAAEGPGDEDVNVDLIMDLPLQVVVELGRSKMLINDLLQIGQGSVIELNKQVGEPLDVLVNGKLVARGEVVVVKDKFGVRITDVLSTIERIEQLG